MAHEAMLQVQIAQVPGKNAHEATVCVQSHQIHGESAHKDEKTPF
ncbi:hypothetical protein [Bifidobacterium dolichotidis]|nr:hypothetical protein [Bifidobacterium dolichotidis]